jgi:hypothetical protein
VAHDRRARERCDEADRKLERESAAQIVVLDAVRDRKLLAEAHSNARDLIHKTLSDAVQHHELRDVLDTMGDAFGDSVRELLDDERTERKALGDKLRDTATELAIAQVTIGSLREQMAHSHTERDHATGQLEATRKEVSELRSCVSALREVVATLAVASNVRGLPPLPSARDAD